MSQISCEERSHQKLKFKPVQKDLKDIKHHKRFEVKKQLVTGQFDYLNIDMSLTLI